LRGTGASSDVAAAKLSGKASELDDVGLVGCFSGSAADVVLSAVLAASSSIFSICTSVSAPRLVSTGGGPGLISGALSLMTAPLAATVCCTAGCGSLVPMPT